MSLPSTPAVTTQTSPKGATADLTAKEAKTGDEQLLAAPDVIFPTGDFYSDEPPLESDLHRDQIDLLLRLLRWLWREEQANPPSNYRCDFYASGNLTIYYSPNQLKSEYFRGPDFFVVLGSDPQPRKSWVVWEENGKYPNVIIELLSDSTAKVDQGLKKEIYQDTFRTPNYFWFDPYTLELQGFELMAGSYQDLEPNEQGWLWCGQLQLFLGIHERQLRFFLPSGELVETPEEEAIAQQQQAEAEYQRAEAAQAQAEAERTQKERLATKLRELGVDPTSL